MSARYTLVFDGVCNLCNGVVRFIVARDPEAKFRFVPMQSDAARPLIERHHGGRDELDTFLLVRDEECLTRSDAALAIARELPWPWPLLAAFKILPRALRDFAYDALASRRYRLFGRRDACVVPTPAVRDRFLADPAQQDEDSGSRG